MSSQKLFCYVDETGQDTKGQLFIVSVVIAQEDREQLIETVEALEQMTGKKSTKWHKTEKSIKASFIEQLFHDERFKGTIFCSSYKDASAYQELTVLTIATAIHAVKPREKYKASIFIDGLQKSEIIVVGAKLRKIGVHTEKVRGVRDESHALIRLADAIAGFIRECNDGLGYASSLYELGIKNKILIEV
ncbi:MAG: DUF3800 domain-containing protein [Caldilineaceae bacterium]